jgi:hypothetical protein
MILFIILFIQFRPRGIIALKRPRGGGLRAWQLDLPRATPRS